MIILLITESEKVHPACRIFIRYLQMRLLKQLYFYFEEIFTMFLSREMTSGSGRAV